MITRVPATRLVRVDDASRLAGLLRDNRDFLAPWEPIRPEAFFTAEGQRRVIEDALTGYGRGVTIPRVIISEDHIVGRITLSNVVRGAFLSGNLGYWVAADHNGRGLATAAVGEIREAAFGRLGLHRIEAGTLPHNVASQRVLQRNGFERIGLARNYLRIAGRWEDHVIYQVLNAATP